MGSGTQETPPQAAGHWEVEFDSTRLVFGEHSLKRLGEECRRLGCTRVLIVTDMGLSAVGHTERAVNALRSAGVGVRVFEGVEENPTTRHVNSCARSAKGLAVDGLVALGGGSALDCAKAANFLVSNGGRMEDYWGSGKAGLPMLPSIGIPTTAGTGSDAQSYAVIAQDETGVKMACGDRKAKFRTVLLDPLVAATVPRPVAAASGIDAVSHVIESYVSLRANPISRLFAAEAWRLIDANLQEVLSGTALTDTWGRMLLGAHLAGASIEHSMLGAAHACANALTTFHKVPHGIAVGLMLPHVMRFNEREVAGLYAVLHGDGSLLDRVEELRGLAGFSAELRDYEVPRNCLEELAEAASVQWTAGFNPRPAGKRELLELYEAAY